MRANVLWIVVAGAGLMAGTAWLSYPRPPKHEPGKAYRFMSCRECGWEWHYNADLFEKGCRRCRDGPALVATMTSVKVAGGPPSPLPRLIAPLLIEVNVLLAVVWYLTRP